MRSLALGAVGIGVALSQLGGCGRGSEFEGTVREHSAAPNEGMKGVTIRNFVVGDTRWVLQADSASVFRSRKRVEAFPVEVDFFEGDRHVSTLTAEVGVLLQTTDDLEARGDVKVVTEEGTVLTTDVLYWDHQKALIHTDRFVRIDKGGDVLTGVGLEADPGLDRIDIKENVRGLIRDPEELLDESDGQQS